MAGCRTEGIRMCFSTEASLTAAVVLTAVGTATCRTTGWSRATPLAAIPLVFAAHQAMEGQIWRELDAAGGQVLGGVAVYAYTLIAYVLWPLLVPAAVWLVEPDARRRNRIALLATAGLAAALFYIQAIATGTPIAIDGGRGIHYELGGALIGWFAIPYVAATCGSLLASSSTLLRWSGVAWAAGAATATAIRDTAMFASTWCFFAAATSILLLAWARSDAREPASVQRC